MITMSLFRYLIICALVMSWTTVQAAPITISILPASQSVNLGSTTTVNLTIAGLGNHVAPSLGTFDLNIDFNPTILGFSTFVFGDPVLGDQLDLFG